MTEGETYVLIIERNLNPLIGGAVAPLEAAVAVLPETDPPRLMRLEAEAQPPYDKGTGKDTVP